MLFEFGKFWKSLLFVIFSLSLYTFVGFEPVVIILFSILCSDKLFK